MIMCNLMPKGLMVNLSYVNVYPYITNVCIVLNSKTNYRSRKHINYSQTSDITI